MCRLNYWCTVLLIVSSCWILFALSGCGGIFVVNGAGTGALTASPNTVTFGAVSLGQTASTPLALLNGSSAPVQITQLSLTGQSFSLVSPSDLPVTIAAGGTYSLNVQFNPAAAGMATGQLTIASNASSSGAMVIGLRGTGATAGGAILSSLSCTSSALIGSAADACTLTLSAAAGSGGLTVSLASNNSAITVPSTVTVPVGKISAGFTATASSVSTAQTVTLTATAGGVSETFALQLGAAVPTLSVNSTSVAFGSVVVNTVAAPQPVILTSTGTVPVTINGAALTGTGFTVSGITFPATLNPGQAATLDVEFEPTAAGAVTGQLTITSNSSTGSSTVISLSGAGTAAPAALSALSCSSGVMTGSGTDACTVTLTASAPSGGLIVNLSSSSSAVTVPSTVTVPAGAASAGFTATVSPVTTAQAVTLTASAGSATKTFVMQLNASVPTLTVATSNSPITYGGTVTFTATISSGPTGTVTFYNGAISIGVATINGEIATLTTSSLIAGSHTITANWPGNSNYAAITSGAITQVVNKATPAIFWNSPAAITYGTALGSTQLDATSTVAGAFSYSPAAGTVLSSGAHTITATFTPTDTTDYATATDSVSVTVNAALSLLSCSSGTITGAGTDTCTVTLTAAAPSGGLTVNLSSSDSTVTVPSTVTIPAGVASAEFTATVSSVATAQTATITASVGSMFTSYTLQLNATILALTINPASVAFGNVVVNTPTTQQITLTSTGTAPVTINGITLTGAGFTLSGPALPITLTPNQATTVDISFDPTAVGAATGQLTITSNSSANGTAVIGLSGTGTPVPAVSVAVTPTNPSVTTGTTQQFTASVTGASNTAVTWTESGLGCSGATCGAISSSGLYTAPAAVPSPAAVTITATSVSDTTKSASASVTILPPPGATYYLAPASAGGNDSNNGLSPTTPWLTPNHSVNCGDVLTAEAGTYSSGNFQSWEWGIVTCAAGNNVAWVKCATFDGCKINSPSGQPGIQIGKSYWGVQGFEVTTSGGNNYAACFTAYSTMPIHHIIFADNIANGCEASGIGLSNTTVSASFDYVAIIGNIAYNAAQSNTECYSGMSVYEPIASDSLAGTHLYIAGNFSFDNVDPAGCAYDGSGIILDTLDGSQEGLSSAYNQQIVVDNNITVFNGAAGVVEGGGGNTAANVYVEHNTAYGNYSSSLLTPLPCGQIALNNSPNPGEYTLIDQNLAVVQASTPGCASGQAYAYWISNGNATDKIYSTYAYSALGNNVGTYNSAGFSSGPNLVTDMNPTFTNPVNPGAPSCNGTVSVSACMAQLIANFTPTNAAAKGYGYQIPSSTPAYDPLYPQWLCSVTNLPTGLVTPGCAQAASAN